MRSKDQIMRIQGSKCNNCCSIWALKPYYLGPWTLGVHYRIQSFGYPCHYITIDAAYLHISSPFPCMPCTITVHAWATSWEEKASSTICTSTRDSNLKNTKHSGYLSIDLGGSQYYDPFLVTDYIAAPDI